MKTINYLIALVAVVLLSLSCYSSLAADVIYFGPNLILGPMGHLDFALAGTSSGIDYNRIDAQSNVVLDGTLNVALANGFIPQEGDTFDLLDFDPARLSGSFRMLNLPPLTGDRQWDTSRLYTHGELSVYIPCPLTADFTGDCQVDLYDFAIMAKAWLSSDGSDNWNQICDISTPANGNIDIADLAELAGQWLN
ncbi:MAG: hypothetical protein JXM68_06555 [Sedimentisphaerales bacterium]|nr:hypothetical protein [Sedimentisphaerales bacterium]